MAPKKKPRRSKSCNHVCCDHCGYKEPDRNEKKIQLKDESYVYPNDLKALINSCCPKDQRKLVKKIKYFIEQDSREVLEILPSIGYKICSLNAKQQTIVHLAFYEEAHNILNYNGDSVLFKKYKDHTNYSDSYGLSHLHVACVTGDIKMVKKYLDDKEDVNLRFHSDPSGDRTGFTPLHFAATNECRDIVKLLLQRGADANATDCSGSTPLHLACGATDTICRVSEGTEPFENLRFDSKYEIVELLLKYGSHIDAKDEQGITALFYCLSHFNKTKITYSQGKELHAQRRKIFELLLKHNADTTIISNDNENLLHWIISASQVFSDNDDDTSCAELIERLLSANQKLNVNYKSSSGETPLQIAISSMNVNVTNVLLKFNANLPTNIQFDFPKDLPRLEEVRNMISMIELLLDNGYNFTLKNYLIMSQYLIHNYETCGCMEVESDEDGKCEEYKYIMWMALYHGLPAHLDHVLTKLQSDDFASYLFLYSIRIKKLGLFNDKQHIIDKTKHSKKLSAVDLRKLEEELDTEINRMKSTDLQSGITLYNIMMESPSKIYRHIKSGEIEKLLSEFKDYREVIRAHIVKSLTRNFIEKTAYEYFKSLPLLPPLPDLCCNIIANYLTNEDIFNFGTAIVNSSEPS